MSPKTNEPPTASYPTPSANDTPSDSRQPRIDPHDASVRLTELQMNEGRASGELEGSTLGSSSRDGDKGSRVQRRTQSSGGFFVDSSFLPGSRSLKNTHQLLRRSGSDRRQKREAPEPGLEAYKKRSRFPWSRQKEEKPDSVEATTTEEATIPWQVTEDAAGQEQGTEPLESQATTGLDKDSLQIVNLALNLSESRDRNSLGRSASSHFPGSRRIVSASQPTASYPNTQPIASAGGLRHSSSQRHDTVHAWSDRYNKPSVPERVDFPAHTPSSVLSLLPQSVDSEALPSGASESTLIRAEKARRHFELFSEYLRLLSSLPPLEHLDPSAADSVSAASNSEPSSRTYNPLQCIRNRKVRFRERCIIDAEAEGWYDTDRVHEWVDSVESLYSHRNHSPVERLQLPSFQKSRKHVPQEPQIDVDHLAASPPSSLRRASRTSSVKARRPRSDWVIDPAELLADAAWVEDDHNKSKLVDKDGNYLYPDSNMLIDVGMHDAGLSLEEKLQRHRESMESERYTSRASLSDAHPSVTSGARGRQRHRFRSSGRSTHDSEVSVREFEPGSRKLGLFSSSASTSSADDRLYRYTHADRAISPGKYHMPTLDASITRGSGAYSEDDSLKGIKYNTYGSFPRNKPGHVSAKARSEGKRSSMSSVPSIDDRYGPLTNMATAESRSPDIHSQLGVFPSIASNLSPPSSRSPSPSKGRFSRARGSRHERSKSNIRSKDNADENMEDADAVRQDSLSEATGRIGSEPNPLTYQISSSSYQDEINRLQFPMRKDTTQTESRLRGILKGPGKIAEKVGNEMSKVGDRIKKKDSLAHARKPSLYSLSSSDFDMPDEAEEMKSDKLSGAKSLLRRLPTFADDSNRALRKNLDKVGTSNDALLSPSLMSPAGQEQFTQHPSSESTNVPGQAAEANIHRDQDTSQRDVGSFPTDLASRPDVHAPITRFEKLRFGPEIHTFQEQINKGRIRDQSVPFSLTRPPVTGLAQAGVEATPASSHRRPALDAQSSSWSISNRSISTSLVSGIPGKREVERTRALLLSSGIKAREITRRADTVREPPPEFLLRSYDDGPVPVPRVTRLCEYDAAAQGLLRRFEETNRAFQQAMGNFSGSVSSPLTSQLSRLEKVVNESISPRVQAATQDAEDLSIQLNTTSTLAVKQLSDTLDKGIRRRHRRLRWVRRTGFVMLEWALVGMLWWVWLIVMAFKVLRGLFRGFLSGVRWVLWL